MFIYYRKTICEHGNFSGREKTARKKGQFKSITAFLSVFLDKTKAPKPCGMGLLAVPIIALRNEKGSYNFPTLAYQIYAIIALRNEKGSYNENFEIPLLKGIIALRNEKGSYNWFICRLSNDVIIALRNEKGSYNHCHYLSHRLCIIALRNEKGSYNKS